MSPADRATFRRTREKNERTQSPAMTERERVRRALHTKAPTLRQSVKLILMLQLEGKTRPEIAEALGLAPSTITAHLRRAGKRGLIPAGAQIDPRDRIDYVLTHKALNRIEAAIDSPNQKTAAAMAFKVADATVFKSYDHDKTPAPTTTNVLAIKIEPTGPTAPLREGSVGGTPGYLDGEIDE